MLPTLSKQDLQRIFWLSGSTCAGKTTVASAIAETQNWNVYHCDDWEHAQKINANAKHQPHWYAYSQLTGDELWLRPVDQHVSEALVAYDEQFALILADLATLLQKDRRPLLYDGYVAPAQLVSRKVAQSQMFYLITTEDFQRRYYSQRPWIDTVLAKTSNPTKAWENWMLRDVLIARHLQREAERYQMPWLLVDGSRSLTATIEQVTLHFTGEQCNA